MIRALTKWQNKVTGRNFKLQLPWQNTVTSVCFTANEFVQKVTTTNHIMFILAGKKKKKRYKNKSKVRQFPSPSKTRADYFH